MAELLLSLHVKDLKVTLCSNYIDSSQVFIQDNEMDVVNVINCI